MDAAWGQIGDVLAANRRIRLATVAQAATTVWWSTHLKPLRDLSAERSLHASQRRCTAGWSARGSWCATSSRSARRADGAALARRTPGAAAARPRRRSPRLRHPDRAREPDRPGQPGRGQRRAAAGDAAGPTDRRGGRRRAGQAPTPGPLGPLVDLIRRLPWLVWVLLGVVLLLALLVLLLVPGRRVDPRRSRSPPSASPRSAGCAGRRSDRRCPTSCCRAAAPPTSIDSLPGFPGFTIEEPGSGAADRPPAAGPDSAEAARFKAAIKDTHRLVSSQRHPRHPADALSGGPRDRGGRGRRRSRPGAHHPGLHDGRRSGHPAADRRDQPRGVPRGDGLSRVRHPDVPTAARPARRQLPPQHRQDPAEHDHPPRDQPALHRGLHARRERTMAPSCSGASTPPTSGAATSDSSGTPAPRSTGAGSPRRSCARSCATSRRSTPGRASPSSVTTTTASCRGRPRRRSCSSSAASCSRSTPPR